MNIGMQPQDNNTMRDGLAARHLHLCTFLNDVDPLLVTGRLRELVDAVLQCASIRVRVLEFHLWDLVRNGEIGLSHRQNLGHGHARRGLLQRRLAAGKRDDRHFSHHEVDRAR